MKKILGVLAVLLFLGSINNVADAQSRQPQGTQCDDRVKIHKLLAEKYKEAVISAGVTTSGGLIEVLSAPEGYTWTIVVTTPDGISCLVAAGEGWRVKEYQSPDDKLDDLI